MADRSLLVRKKLPEFREWLEAKGNCRIEKVKGSYECLRFKINDATHLIFENHRSVHLSIPSKTVYLVRRFLSDRKAENTKEIIGIKIMSIEELTEKVSELEKRLGRAESRLTDSIKRNIKIMDNMIIVQQNLNTLVDIINPSPEKELLV